MKARTVEVKSIKLLKIPDPDHAEFCATTSKGFYVRSLARDLGLELGTFGHIVALRRSQVGTFYEKDSILLDSLLALEHSRDKFKALLPVERALDDIPALQITPVEAERIRMGQRIPYFGKRFMENQNSVAICDGVVIALITLNSGIIRPVRVFNIQ